MGIKQIVLQRETDLKYKYKKELIQGNGLLSQRVSKKVKHCIFIWEATLGKDEGFG